MTLLTIMIFILGACVGSFLNVCIWRIPRGESIVWPGSHCPKCNCAIAGFDNIPLLSWLLLRGRCRSCRNQISVRYPLIEMFTALLFTAVWMQTVIYRGQPPVVAVMQMFLTAVLLAAAIIDVEHLIIPDRLIFPAAAAGLLFTVFFPVVHFPGFTYYGYINSHFITDRVLYLLSLRSVNAGGAVSAALISAGLGILVGGGTLWIIMESGKILWGRLKHTFPKPKGLRITASALEVEGLLEENWEDILLRGNDSLRAEVTALTAEIEADPDTAPRLVQLDNAEITVARGYINIGQEKIPLKQLKSLSAQVSSLTVPREVMGFGDVKLMAMTGLFLGPEACLFILTIGALSGSVAGLFLVFGAGRRRETPLPFGLFLSWAAAVWILLEPYILSLYEKILFGF